MGIFNNIVKVVDKGVDIVDKAVVDQDEALKLKTELIRTLSSYLLSGPGASITKITICILVSVVVFVGTYIFLVKPKYIEGFKDYALSVTPLIGILIGAYGTGAAIGKVIKK